MLNAQPANVARVPWSSVVDGAARTHATLPIAIRAKAVAAQKYAMAPDREVSESLMSTLFRGHGVDR